MLRIIRRKVEPEETPVNTLFVETVQRRTVSEIILLVEELANTSKRSLYENITIVEYRYFIWYRITTFFNLVTVSCK